MAETRTDVLLDHYLRAQRAFGERVHAVSEDQWGAPTPDTEWTVDDLVRHLIEEQRWAAPLIHGQDLDAARMIVEGSRSLPTDGGVGGNAAEEWDEAATEAANAFSEDGALDRTVKLSRGDTPAIQYIREMTADLIIHGWDLQTAIGFDGTPLPEDVVEAIYGLAQQAGDMSSSGMFKAPVEVDDSASTLDKLVGLTGRTPR